MRNISKPLPPLSENDIARFWSHVDKRGPDDCWPWLGRIKKNGYADLRLGGRWLLSHRLAYFLHFGSDPCPLLVCHTCDVRYAIGDISYRKCCNAIHLFSATNAENSRDMAIKGRAASGDRNSTHLYSGLRATWRKEWNGQAYCGPSMRDPQTLCGWWNWDPAFGKEIWHRTTNGDTHHQG